ncbi:MAG: hypothetical protein IT452_21660 [Planctomycetia bacterium]|nr:hypothetical protein [Planctomycetia bacterium]
MQIISRTVAARFFASRLRPFTDVRTLVLASSRNAVPLACALASEIECPVDVLLTRELRLPDDPAHPVGAVGEEGEILWTTAFNGARVSQEALARCILHDIEMLVERRGRWTPRRGPEDVSGRTVVIVAEGVASGAGLAEALEIVRLHGPKRLYAVVACATPDALRRIRPVCDGLTCLDVAASYSDVARSLVGAEPIPEALAIELLGEFAKSGSAWSPA